MWKGHQGFGLGLNRTIQELKYSCIHGICLSLVCLNRTIQELKFPFAACLKVFQMGLNRTIQELKLKLTSNPKSSLIVLIVPYRN